MGRLEKQLDTFLRQAPKLGQHVYSMKIPPGSLVLGAPAKIVRPLTRRERARLKIFAAKYVGYAAYCLEHDINVGAPLAA